MKSRGKLKELLKNKVVCVLAPGKSLEILEKYIDKFKDLDVLWIGMNYCEYIERDILSKIRKRFSMISDCTNVANPKAYEPERLGKFIQFLSREEKNLLFISETVIKDCFENQKKMEVFEKYEKKIATIDEVFTGTNYPKSLWDKPPNSITLLFAALTAGLARKVILFGYDGKFHGNYQAITSYYGSDILREHRKKAYGKDYDIGSLTSDSRDFEKTFPAIYNTYKKIYKNPDIEILNCSPKSVFNVFRKIAYDEVIKEVEKVQVKKEEKE